MSSVVVISIRSVCLSGYINSPIPRFLGRGGRGKGTGAQKLPASAISQLSL